MKSKPIDLQNIIFDFGGVLIDLDMEKCRSEFQSLFGISSLSTPPFESIFQRYEVGAISEDEWVRELQEQTDHDISRLDILHAWNSMIDTMPMVRLNMLRSLSERYHLYLLSNTNVTHIQYVYRYLQRVYEIDDFGQSYFTKAYFSHLVKMRKPHAIIYQHVLDDAAIEAAQSLFIDDNAENVAGAQSVGLHAVLHDPMIDITEVIDDYIDRSTGKV